MGALSPREVKWEQQTHRNSTIGAWHKLCLKFASGCWNICPSLKSLEWLLHRGSSVRDIHKPLTPHWNSDWTEVLFQTLRSLTLNLNKILIHDTLNMQLNQSGISHRAALPNTRQWEQEWPTFISFWSGVLDKCRKFGKYVHSSCVGFWMLWWEFQVPEKQQGAGNEQSGTHYLLTSTKWHFVTNLSFSRLVKVFQHSTSQRKAHSCSRNQTFVQAECLRQPRAPSIHTSVSKTQGLPCQWTSENYVLHIFQQKPEVLPCWKDKTVQSVKGSVWICLPAEEHKAKSLEKV